MLVRSAHRRWLAVILAASFSLGAVRAVCKSVDPHAAVVHVRADPPAGFSEVPDQAGSDQSVSIEPVVPLVDPARPEAAEFTKPSRTVAAAHAAPAPGRAVARPMPVDPMIDGQAPPLAVLISFPRNKPGAKLQADALAQTLRGLGISVDEAPIRGAAPRSARIGYVFAPDRPAALAISVNAGARYGFVDPVSVPSTAVPDARPGLIAILLPG